MNDIQIDYFMAVATNLSFTKTSEELFVSQPAISKQISQLENELGVKLFNRNNKKTELTDAGRLYFDLFSKYKAEFINTKLEADRISGKNKHMIRVGFLEGWELSNIIPQMMEMYAAKHPDAEVIINCCGVKELSKGLLTNSIDIVVTMKNSINMYKEFKCSDAAEIGKILIYSDKHHLADKDVSELSLRDFSEDVFLAPWEIVEKMIADAISNYTRPYGFVPNLRFVKNHESTITCVRNNMGVTIGDELMWAKDAEDLKWIPFNASDIVSVARLTAKASENIVDMEEILIEILKKEFQK